MGAVVNMRPDLFKAVVARVPFVDVINSMYDESLPLTVGEFEEWGNPKVPEQYVYMRSYSPYDNLEAKAYPAMLVKTSFDDSQVMYWEPAKYVAKLRTLKTDSNPLIFKINMAGGHGGSSGRYDKLREVAYDYAFQLTQMGITTSEVAALVLLDLCRGLRRPPAAPAKLQAQFIGNMAFAITDGKTALYTDFPYESGAFGYMATTSRRFPRLPGACACSRTAIATTSMRRCSRRWMRRPSLRRKSPRRCRRRA